MPSSKKTQASAPKNPLVYDKVTGVYQKASKQSDVSHKRTYESFRKSTPYAYTGESLDVSEVYVSVKKTSSYPAAVSFQKTYIKPIEVYNGEYRHFEKFENIIPTHSVKYISEEFI